MMVLEFFLLSQLSNPVEDIVKSCQALECRNYTEKYLRIIFDNGLVEAREKNGEVIYYPKMFKFDDETFAMILKQEACRLSPEDILNFFISFSSIDKDKLIFKVSFKTVDKLVYRGYICNLYLNEYIREYYTRLWLLTIGALAESQNEIDPEYMRNIADLLVKVDKALVEGSEKLWKDASKDLRIVKMSLNALEVLFISLDIQMARSEAKRLRRELENKLIFVQLLKNILEKAGLTYSYPHLREALDLNETIPNTVSKTRENRQFIKILMDVSALGFPSLLSKLLPKNPYLFPLALALDFFIVPVFKEGTEFPYAYEEAARLITLAHRLEQRAGDEDIDAHYFASLMLYTALELIDKRVVGKGWISKTGDIIGYIVESEEARWRRYVLNEFHKDKWEWAKTLKSFDAARNVIYPVLFFELPEIDTNLVLPPQEEVDCRGISTCVVNHPDFRVKVCEIGRKYVTGKIKENEPIIRYIERIGECLIQEGKIDEWSILNEWMRGQCY